eukprot:353851-Chlamydomonas_euryale.AAC.5
MLPPTDPAAFQHGKRSSMPFGRVAPSRPCPCTAAPGRPSERDPLIGWPHARKHAIYGAGKAHDRMPHPAIRMTVQCAGMESKSWQM